MGTQVQLVLFCDHASDTQALDSEHDLVRLFMTITLTEVRTPGRTEPEDDLVCLDEGRQATTRRDSREILLAAQVCSAIVQVTRSTIYTNRCYQARLSSISTSCK